MKKLKIVVEGNIVQDGLTIKESSKHFTAYLTADNQRNTVDGILKIIEKQEKMFTKKD